MANLMTNYMGLKLANPVIAGSCSLTGSVKGVQKCADAGAGAVVLKSLFEEQIVSELQDIASESWPYTHPEASEYLEKMGMALGPRDYLKLVEDSKKAVSIPVIASLNCVSSEQWLDYAGQLASAGADALELNIALMPGDPDISSKEIEDRYLAILKEVRGRLNIPVAVKLGPYFSSMARLANELAKRGAAALVLLNRFYQLDIDVEKEKLIPANRFSSPEEMSVPLRWIALLAGKVDCSLAATTGIHDGAGAVKQILAGADAVQVCSVLYMKGIEHIKSILDELEDWMDGRDYAALDDFRGTLSHAKSGRPEQYERLQYIKALTGIE